jgi:hypothetical protein
MEGWVGETERKADMGLGCEQKTQDTVESDACCDNVANSFRRNYRRGNRWKYRRDDYAVSLAQEQVALLWVWR